MRRIRTILILFIVVSSAGLFVVKSRGQYLKDTFRVDFVSSSPAHWRKVFERYQSKLGPGDMLTILEEAYPLCHSQAHDLGKVIFNETKDFAASLRVCGDGCTAGCFHGVLMEAFGESQTEGASGHLSLQDIKAKITTICDDPAIRALHRKGKCVHGIGHAITQLANYDLERSLSACGFFDDKRLEYYCSGGVFMEYDAVYGDRSSAQQSFHYPCDSFTRFPTACYPHKMKHLQVALGSREKVIRECLGLKGYSRRGCFYGLGFLYNLEVETNPYMLGAICRDGTLDDQRLCLEGAIIKLTEINPEKALVACGARGDKTRSFCEKIAKIGPYSLDRPFDLYFDTVNF